MRKTVKTIISVLMACLLIFGGSTMAFAADDALNDAGSDLVASVAKGAFPSFKEYVEKNGTKGIFSYVPYIIFAAPIVFLMGTVFGSLGIASIGAFGEIIKDISNK